MHGFKVFTAAEQVAAHLREELMRGTWVGLMPGEDRLMARLGIGRNTIKAALKILEEQGMIEGRGAGRQRRINLPMNRPTQALRISILLYENSDREMHLENLIYQRLRDAGHIPSFSEKSLIALGMDPKRIERHVSEIEADAWVVSAGSAEVLQWFASKPTPVFALFGRFTDIDIAGVGIHMTPIMQEIVRRLVKLGHRRIVMLSRKERVMPNPAYFERAFLDCLKECGIPTSSFNLPVWNADSEGLHHCLGSLLRHTPPTAFYIVEPHLFISTRHYLSTQGLLAPRDLSLICGEPDLSFTWSKPVVSHLRWEPRRLAQRVTQWANGVAADRCDLKQTRVNAEFVEGGTIGPPPSFRT